MYNVAPPGLRSPVPLTLMRWVPDLGIECSGQLTRLVLLCGARRLLLSRSNTPFFQWPTENPQPLPTAAGPSPAPAARSPLVPLTLILTPPLPPLPCTHRVANPSRTHATLNIRFLA